MKKTIKRIIYSISTLVVAMLLVFVCLPIENLAAGGIYPSSNYLSIPVGGVGTFSVVGDNAAGYFSCSTSGPISATVNGETFVDMNSVTVTVNAHSPGEGVVYINIIDAATYDDEVLKGSYSVYVSVYQPQEDPGAGTGGEDYDFSASGEGSADASLKKLEVEGYELKDEGNDIFSCYVGKDVKKVNIVAEVNDTKATVEGIGEKELKDGANEFTVIVKAENGDKRSYKIIIYRGVEKVYSLKDLKTEITKIKEESVKVKLEDKDVLDKEILEAIKKANKTVILEKYDGEKLLYSWTIIGKNITNMDSFDPTVTFEPKDKTKTDKLVNYLSGINLNFAYKGELPKGTKFALNVSDKYKDNDVLYLYYIDTEKVEMTLEASEIKVKAGLAELEIKHCSEYFLTQSVPLNVEDSKSATYLIIMLAEGIVILGLVIFIIIFALKKKNKKTEKLEAQKDENIEKLNVPENKNTDETDEIDIIEYGRTKE